MCVLMRIASPSANIRTGALLLAFTLSPHFAHAEFVGQVSHDRTGVLLASMYFRTLESRLSFSSGNLLKAFRSWHTLPALT